MGNKRKNYIDDMVEQFGYDYVIGFCLCSEYDIRRKAEVEEDKEKRAKLNSVANKYKAKANELIKERFDNGL